MGRGNFNSVKLILPQPLLLCADTVSICENCFLASSVFKHSPLANTRHLPRQRLLSASSWCPEHRLGACSSLSAVTLFAPPQGPPLGPARLPGRTCSRVSRRNSSESSSGCSNISSDSERRDPHSSSPPPPPARALPCAAIFFPRRPFPAPTIPRAEGSASPEQPRAAVASRLQRGRNGAAAEPGRQEPGLRPAGAAPLCGAAGSGETYRIPQNHKISWEEYPVGRGPQGSSKCSSWPYEGQPQVLHPVS